MPLSKEEVAQISKVVAAEVMKGVREERHAYHDPTSARQGLQESMGEELMASMFYGFRAKHAEDHGDKKTAELYRHIALEENQHYSELNKRLLEFAG